MNKLKVGVIQMKVEPDKKTNLEKAAQLVRKISAKGADLVILPEMFTCPYESSGFPLYAEEEGDYSYNFLSNVARHNNIYLVAGSFPEKENNKFYNTSYVFNKNGEQIAKHRKVHLFDIDIKDKQQFKESDTLSAGNKVTVFDIGSAKIGLCICYDFRFPEFSRLMVDRGAQVIVVPASFNMTTGSAHWELLFKARAVDNQVYTIGCSTARNYKSSYVSYGNSLIVSPYGDILSSLDENEGYIYYELDLDYIDKIRQQLPLLNHRRKNLYELIEK